MTINIIATLQALPGKEEQLLAVLSAALAPTRLEAGNLRYELYRSDEDATSFVFVEQFADAAAFAIHQNSTYIATLGAGVADLLAKPPSIVEHSQIIPA